MKIQVNVDESKVFLELLGQKTELTHQEFWDLLNHMEGATDSVEEFKREKERGGERKRRRQTMKILNLTQHVGTPDQGVYEPKDKERVQRLLTFEEIPDENFIRNRAIALAELANAECVSDKNGERYAMIGGAPFLMSTLERELLKRGIFPVYAFSQRVVSEKNGLKTSTFRHEGFIFA